MLFRTFCTFPQKSESAPSKKEWILIVSGAKWQQNVVYCAFPRVASKYLHKPCKTLILFGGVSAHFPLSREKVRFPPSQIPTLIMQNIGTFGGVPAHFPLFREKVRVPLAKASGF